MSAEIKEGDYVLATKWHDGDSGDQWCVGFYQYTNETTGRHFVVDNEGVPFRHTGFRRIKKISAKRGAWLLANASLIEQSRRSLWYWVRHKMVDII